MRASYPCASPGKLPGEKFTEEYALEYGTNTLEIHADAVTKGKRVLVIDDLLATGGTMAATLRLLERLGAHIAGVAVLIELDRPQRPSRPARRGRHVVHQVLTHPMRLPAGCKTKIA